MPRKTAIGAAAALTFAAVALVAATPSLAEGGIGGNWQGGGMGGGYNWGGAVAAGVIGGAAGAIAGSALSYGPPYGATCYWHNQPRYDGRGNIMGYQPVVACY
ncbi:MAG: hypothetical protein L0Y50_10550 [Beijerinckiaceae bacterium]|nr:hypothetical protein [Beijerinckiaceae bacterium]MCI0736691.1 hypothetical protein [Beijerinckiaceae bacterium]